MGGNVTATVKTSGVKTRAQKVNLLEIERSEFVKTFKDLFKHLNKEFCKTHDSFIWDEVIIDNATVFNGSTSFIMDENVGDDVITTYKPLVGDIDITVPRELKEKMWRFLDTFEEKEVIPGVTYMGSNKPSIHSIGEQMNCVFIYNNVNVQVDFEFLEYDCGRPTEWSSFSHNAILEDTVLGIKAVNHKFLLQSIIGTIHILDNVVIATPSSTPENIKISKSSKNSQPRMLKFSVARGVRRAYEAMCVDGNIILIDGKPVYKEIKPKDSTYITDLDEIFKLAFNANKVSSDEKIKFKSFIGVTLLIKKYLTPHQIQDVHDRYIEMLWGNIHGRAQELEADSAILDQDIKQTAYDFFVDELNLVNKSYQYISEYYSTYGQKR